MAIILWSSLRQLEAIRSAFFISLTQGGACQTIGKDSKKSLHDWAKREEIDLQWLLHESEESLEDLPDSDVGAIGRVGLAWNRGIIHDAGDAYGAAVVEGTRTTTSIAPDTDYGPDRSSAHWDRWDNFLTTSAMLRFMGTLEQFEIETLKSLLHYRPEGTNLSPEDYPEIEVEESVIHEEPETRSQVQYYKQPALWTWIRRSAEDNSQRRQIFSRVFDIKFPQPDFGKKHVELCEMRNAIAHGRKRVDITLRELIQIHCYVMKTLIEIRDSVHNRYRLIL